MTNISKHSILRKCYELMQDIEKTDTSPEETAAIIKAGELMDALEVMVDSMRTRAILMQSDIRHDCRVPQWECSICNDYYCGDEPKFCPNCGVEFKDVVRKEGK